MLILQFCFTFILRQIYYSFQKYLDIDTTLSSDKVLDLTNSLVTKLNALLKKLKSVFLVEDFVESLKFGVGKFQVYNDKFDLTLTISFGKPIQGNCK